jgi:hypothetical protein
VPAIGERLRWPATPYSVPPSVTVFSGIGISRAGALNATGLADPAGMMNVNGSPGGHGDRAQVPVAEAHRPAVIRPSQVPAAMTSACAAVAETMKNAVAASPAINFVRAADALMHRR